MPYVLSDLLFILASGACAVMAAGVALWIIDALFIQDKTFACHKTLDYTGIDDDGEGREGPQTQHCAGAMILMEAQDHPNQMMRIAERLGLYDRRRLNMKAPVFDTPGAFIEGKVMTLVDNEAVHSGQVWQDNDPRSLAPRKVKVLEIEERTAKIYRRGRGYVTELVKFALVEDQKSGRKSRIRVDRMRPTSRGWKLVEDVE